MNLLSILAQNAPMMPKGASNFSPDVDFAWNLILGVTGFFFLIVVGAMTLFVIKYRRRTPNDKTAEITHNTPLEIVWTLIPLILVIGFFFVGFKGFINYDTAPTNARIVDVKGAKWNFTFNYPNGAVSDQLWVEKGMPVRLNMTSTDVLHALYIPNFRTQRNLIPYRNTYIWFVPTELSPTPTKDDPGGYSIFCTQYCGDGHSKMMSRVHVLDKEQYEVKMRELANPFVKKEGDKKVYVAYKELGEKLYRQMGCSTCHTLDGGKSTGPTWKDLWKRDHKFGSSNEPGYTLSAADNDEKWEHYLSESMLNPGAKVVEGFNNQMPAYAGQLDGGLAEKDTGFVPNDEKRRAIIEYIKTLGNQDYKPKINPQDNADLFEVNDKNKVHPESLAATKARATQPGK